MGTPILSEILEYKKGVIQRNREKYAVFRKSAPKREGGSSFKSNISKPGQVNLIAEIKKASPSKGLIRKDFDLLSIARIYEDQGAAAISVLTEDKYFLGKPEYIQHVSAEVHVPVLIKDFILDEGQIYEARAYGGSAVLLIAAALADGQLKGLIQLISALGMDSLVEIHQEKELDRVLEAGAGIIGVNNRDLTTFAVDMDTCRRIVPHIPKGTVIVAESGYKTHQEIKVLRDWGIHAVLIGETFMRARDIAQKMKDVMHG
jgi:indole-3-glycerol phosphate synthase